MLSTRSGLLRFPVQEFHYKTSIIRVKAGKIAAVYTGPRSLYQGAARPGPDDDPGKFTCGLRGHLHQAFRCGAA